jgi:hypothetical protein
MSIYSVNQQTAMGTVSGDEVDLVLEHVAECQICLGVIASLQLPTSLCGVRCPEYRALMANEFLSADFSNDSRTFLTGF